MKKFIILIILIVIASIGYVAYVELTKEKFEPLPIEQEQVEVSKYYIYGTSLNIEGSLTVENLNFEDIDLVLYDDKDFLSWKINYTQDLNTINFNLSDLINDGLYLDNITSEKRYIFIRTTHKNEENEEEPIYKYYSLNNSTDYSETTYYTMSKYNKKILINSNNDYNTMMLNITENTDKEIYDIVLDPGHGGIDPGATLNGVKETDFGLDMAQKMKEKLTSLGYTVKLTREEDTLASDEWFDEYGKGGRAQISHEVYAKYLFSIHYNSSVATSVHGLEVYTASDINYDLAKAIADEIVNNTDIDYSTQRTFKMYNGVYTHNFTESEIASSLATYEKKNYTPYDITTNSNYLYMIRETGGIMTGAYVDNRNEDQVGNDYYNSNIGTEAYLLELCYLSNLGDLNTLKEQKDQISEAVVNGINTVLSQK